MKFEIISTIKDFKPSNAKLIREALNHFNGKKVRIIIEKLKSKRSDRQNKFMHALFAIYAYELVNYTGDRKYTPAHVKNMCKTEFLKRDEINEKTGEVMGHYIQDTHLLNKEEMSKFWDEIIQDAAEKHNIILPYPNEDLMLKFE